MREGGPAQSGEHRMNGWNLKSTKTLYSIELKVEDGNYSVIGGGKPLAPLYAAILGTQVELPTVRKPARWLMKAFDTCSVIRTYSAGQSYRPKPLGPHPTN